jgi:hypothetical protein
MADKHLRDQSLQSRQVETEKTKEKKRKTRLKRGKSNGGGKIIAYQLQRRMPVVVKLCERDRSKDRTTGFEGKV